MRSSAPFGAGLQSETTPLICSCVCTAESFLPLRDLSVCPWDQKLQLPSLPLSSTWTGRLRLPDHVSATAKKRKKKKKSWQQAVRVICSRSTGAMCQCFSAPLHSHLSSRSARATVRPSGGRLLLIDMLLITASVSVGAEVKSRCCSFDTWKMVQKGSSLTKAFWKP